MLPARNTLTQSSSSWFCRFLDFGWVNLNPSSFDYCLFPLFIFLHNHIINFFIFWTLKWFIKPCTLLCITYLKNLKNKIFNKNYFPYRDTEWICMNIKQKISRDKLNGKAHRQYFITEKWSMANWKIVANLKDWFIVAKTQSIRYLAICMNPASF